MTLFTVDGAVYEGMDEDTIRALREDLGKGTVFVSKDAFEVAQATAIALEESTKVPVDLEKPKLEWQAQKAKGVDAALSFLAAKLGLE